MSKVTKITYECRNTAHYTLGEFEVISYREYSIEQAEYLAKTDFLSKRGDFLETKSGRIVNRNNWPSFDIVITSYEVSNDNSEQ